MRGNRDSSETEDASLPPRLPSEASANDSQAGLRTHRLNPTCQTSRAIRLSVNLAFVPVYRCGAVPDFHRYSLFTLKGRDPRTRPPYLGFGEIATHTACEYLAHADAQEKQSQFVMGGCLLTSSGTTLKGAFKSEHRCGPPVRGKQALFLVCLRTPDGRSAPSLRL